MNNRYGAQFGSDCYLAIFLNLPARVQPSLLHAVFHIAKLCSYHNDKLIHVQYLQLVPNH